nr:MULTISPECIES: NIL domain-containing protein [unclassified Azospirillum]
MALVRLHALGPVAAGPVLAGFALAGVAASLVAGRVQALKEIPFAALVLALKGDATAIAAEINHLRAQGADIEELGHVAADAVAFN